MARGRLGVLALGVAAVLVAVLLFSAGGDGDEPIGGVSLAEAAGKTIRAGGAEVESEVAMTPKGVSGAPTLTMRGKGFVDATGELMLMDMDISEFAAVLPDDWGMDEDDLKVRYAYDYPVMYMRWPAVVGQIKDGKSWMKIDFSKVLDDVGVDISLFDAENYNPSQQLQFLRAAGGKVERLGTEEIRGEPTVHYRGEVDVRRYPDLVPPAEREKARESAKRFTELTGDPVDPVDVWIGEDGLVRRLRTSWDQVMGEQEVTREQTIDYLGFGKRFVVKPPPAGEVVDLSEEASDHWYGEG